MMKTRGMADEGRMKDMMGRITDENEPQGITFSPPEGSNLDGTSGKATIAWRKTRDGQIEITSVNGVAIGGPAPDEVDEVESEA